MARYISLLRFTGQGARDLKNSTQRARAFAKVAANAGAKIEAQYWTVGAYDGVLILSAPTSEQALRALTELAAAGNVRTETMTLLDAKEFEAVVGS